MAYTYEQELNNLKNAQRNAAVADLENTRNTTLNNLATEEAKNRAGYAVQRNTANVQNRIGAKNFQEYLASTGRANSGIGAQARLQNRNNLNTQLNNINSAENATMADINRQRTLANDKYASGLAAANANIEANYINNLLDQRYKAEQLARDERDFNERVRQFNAQLYSNFNSGSKNSNGSTSNDIDWTDTSNQNSQIGNVAVNNAKNNAVNSTNINQMNKKTQSAAKVGQRYVKYVQTKDGKIVEQLWEKGKKTDKRIA